MNEHVPPNKSGFLRGVIAVLFILFVGAAGSSCLSKLRKRPKKKSNSKTLSLKVETQRTTYKPMVLRLTGYGTVESEHKVEVVPEISGRIIYTIKPFKVGTFVRKGQLLMRINPADFSLEYKRLQAQIRSQKKQIAIAARAYQVSRRNLSRSKRLVRRRALDQSSYERAQQGFLDREQRLESLRQMVQVNQLLLKRAGLNLRRTSIRAPFDARISRGQLTRGSFVAMGRSVATLESVKAVEIPISIPIQELRKVRNAQGESISLKDIPKHLRSLPAVDVRANGMQWKGRVSRLGAKIDLATRTLTMYVRVDLKKQKQIGNLLPGTFCTVSIPVRSMPQAIAIPRRALYEKHVYINQQGTLARRSVHVAHVDNDTAIITGGLKEGESVITTQLADPITGTKVLTYNP